MMTKMTGFDMNARGNDEAMIRQANDPMMVNTIAPSNPVSRKDWKPSGTLKMFPPLSMLMVAILATMNMREATKI